jgi:hypothetical protein
MAGRVATDEDVARLSQEFTALCRERDPIVATVEQPHAKFTLEIVYLELTGGWLMLSRAAAEMQFFGGRAEVPEMT